MAEIQVVFTQVGEKQEIDLSAPRSGNVAGASQETSTQSVPAQKGK
jgi:hypothetical protein